MASDYDATEFVDTDFQAHKSPYATTATGGGALRAPTREEVDVKVIEAQQKLAELKRAQEELERERVALEEVRRRQAEFQTGRQEMIHHLTRGLGLLEEAEFTARRDAEQMAKAIADFRDALTKVEGVREETWSKENFNVELTRALTTIENARMEWNSARLKFPVLSGELPEPKNSSNADPAEPSPFAVRSFADLCRLGLALTWPLALVGLAALGVLVAVLLRR
jgi:multidrug efflux pump subunit AcrA (membrane-fusion protein)